MFFDQIEPPQHVLANFRELRQRNNLMDFEAFVRREIWNVHMYQERIRSLKPVQLRRRKSGSDLRAWEVSEGRLKMAALTRSSSCPKEWAPMSGIIEV